MVDCPIISHASYSQGPDIANGVVLHIDLFVVISLITQVSNMKRTNQWLVTSPRTQIKEAETVVAGKRFAKVDHGCRIMLVCGTATSVHGEETALIAARTNKERLR